MADAVCVAGDVGVEPPLEELLGRPLLAAQAAPHDKIGRRLELAAHAHELLGQALVLLDRPIALGVRDDDLVAACLQRVDGALVLGKIVLGTAARKLEQKLVGAVEVQPIRPLEPELHQLGVVYLPPHLQREALRIGLKRTEGAPHALVVEVRVAHMGCADDAGYADALRHVEHLPALGEAAGSVIHAGKDMAVDVAHVSGRCSGTG